MILNTPTLPLPTKKKTSPTASNIPFYNPRQNPTLKTSVSRSADHHNIMLVWLYLNILIFLVQPTCWIKRNYLYQRVLWPLIYLAIMDGRRCSCKRLTQGTVSKILQLVPPKIALQLDLETAYLAGCQRVVHQLVRS